MCRMGSGALFNILLNSSLKCRLESRNRLKEDLWRGAESGTNEFIGFYKSATPTNNKSGPWSEIKEFSLQSCFYAEGCPHIS